MSQSTSIGVIEWKHYIVKTMPPLKDSRTSRGTAPDQKARMLSSLNMRAAQLKLFLYCDRASIDCML